MERRCACSLIAIALALVAGCGGGDTATDGGPGSQISYSITTQTSAGGTVTPASATVANGGSLTLTITPQSGHVIVSAGGCGGSLTGSVYATGAITENCTIAVTFGPDVRPPGFKITRVSMAADGTNANGNSEDPAISADGRFVVFTSGASNLVSGDTNGYYDVFLHDRLDGTTRRVSMGLNGAQPNNYAVDPAISADGRQVAFLSAASNLVAGDTNGQIDTFVYDRLSGTIERVSVSSAGLQASGGSPDVSWGPPAISADGRFVAFSSDAPNLVADDTNGTTDVFVRDRVTGTTTRVSVASDGSQVGSPVNDDGSYRPSISDDGRYVAFESHSIDLAQNDGAIGAYVHDRLTGKTVCVSARPAGAMHPCMGYRPTVSASGRYVTFESDADDLIVPDTNSMRRDVFIYDQETGQLDFASLTSKGEQVPLGAIGGLASSDGTNVVFISDSSGVADDADQTFGAYNVYVRDRAAAATYRVSASMSGGPPDLASSDPSYSFHRPMISAGGRQVVFHSRATNLVPLDTNGSTDIFVAEW